MISAPAIGKTFRLRLGSGCVKPGPETTVTNKIFIGCVWAAGLVALLMVLGRSDEETSIEIWMWTAGITGLCWMIVKLLRDRSQDGE